MGRDQLQSVFDAIYRAAIEPAAWGEVQQLTQGFFGASMSQLAYVYHDEGNRFLSRTTMMPEIDAELGEIMPRSEPVVWAANNPDWRRFTDYDYIDERGIARSDFYAALRPFDVGYRLALRLMDTPRRSVAMVWIWPPKAGHVQGAELAKLEMIAAPLRLAAATADRYDSRLDGEQSALIAFEGLGLAAFLLRGDGRLLHANMPGAEMLMRRAGLFASGGRLVPCWNGGRAGLSSLIAGAARAGRGGSRGAGPGHLILPRPAGHPPLLLTALPLVTREHFITGPEQLVLVLAEPRQGHRLPPLSVLRRYLGALDLRGDAGGGRGAGGEAPGAERGGE